MSSESSQNGIGVSTSKKAEEIGHNITHKFNDFLETLGNTLMDFTALEVNTMIVSNITGAKFNAFDAYCLIYERARQVNALQAAKEEGDQPIANLQGVIPEKLWPRYQKLYDQLLAAYRTCPGKGQSPILPDPDNAEEFKDLTEQLKVVTFVRTLRKLAELRAALDGEKLDDASSVDLIYAQTVMQIDGDVINRYHQALFDPDNLTRRDIILSIHNQGVQAGERQWKGLMQFMVDLLKNFIPKTSK